MAKCPHCELDTAKKENHYCDHCREALILKETYDGTQAYVARTAYRQSIRNKAYAVRRRELEKMRRRVIRDIMMKSFGDVVDDHERTKRNG